MFICNNYVINYIIKYDLYLGHLLIILFLFKNIIDLHLNLFHHFHFLILFYHKYHYNLCFYISQ